MHSLRDAFRVFLPPGSVRKRSSRVATHHVRLEENKTDEAGGRRGWSIFLRSVTSGIREKGTGVNAIDDRRPTTSRDVRYLHLHTLLELSVLLCTYLLQQSQERDIKRLDFKKGWKATIRKKLTKEESEWPKQKQSVVSEADLLSTSTWWSLRFLCLHVYYSSCPDWCHQKR